MGEFLDSHNPLMLNKQSVVFITHIKPNSKLIKDLTVHPAVGKLLGDQERMSTEDTVFSRIRVNYRQVRTQQTESFCKTKEAIK